MLIMNTHNKNSYITLVQSQWILIQTLVPFQVNGGFARDIFELLHFSYKNNNIFVNNRAIDMIFVFACSTESSQNYNECKKTCEFYG